MRGETAGFEKASRSYERGRPGYPRETVDWIVAAAGLGPGRRVVDLAAGTGKLTRELVSCGAEVVAVEPLAEMRARFAEELARVRLVAGTAEETGLPSGFADAVTVAQAFHWFADDEALAEIHRVLRPSGLLALVWNRRDLSHPVQEAVSRLTAPYVGEAPTYASGHWREVMAASDLFEPAGERRSVLVQQLDRQGLVDRVASTSYVANLPEGTRQDLLESVAALAPDSGTLSLPYDTTAYGFRRR